MIPAKISYTRRNMKETLESEPFYALLPSTFIYCPSNHATSSLLLIIHEHRSMTIIRKGVTNLANDKFDINQKIGCVLQV